jgi:hypothetical protein
VEKNSATSQHNIHSKGILGVSISFDQTFLKARIIHRSRKVQGETGKCIAEGAPSSKGIQLRSQHLQTRRINGRRTRPACAQQHGIIEAHHALEVVHVLCVRTVLLVLW